MSRAFAFMSSVLLAIHVLIAPIYNVSLPYTFSLAYVKQGDACEGWLGSSNTYNSKWRISGGKLFCIKNDNPASLGSKKPFNSCAVGKVGTGPKRCRAASAVTNLLCQRTTSNTKVKCPAGASG